MCKSLISRNILFGVIVLVGLIGGGIFYTLRYQDDKPVGRPSPGFREEGLAAGITWRMEFLPGEQGERFKINLYDHGCGVAVGDFDGDGHEDVYLCNQLGRNALYHNRGDGTFEDVTEKAGVALGDRVCVAATFADYDNDGHLDLFVTSTNGGNVLFHNNGDGTFTDVTDKAGVHLVAHSQTAVFFDYNDDGHLDLLVTNMFGASQLYRNNGNGTFTDVTRDVLGRTSWGAIGSKAFDFNNDGKLDLFIVDMHSDMWLPWQIPPTSNRANRFDLLKKQAYVGGPLHDSTPEYVASEKRLMETFHSRYDEVLFGNTFFKNLGNGTFVETSDKANLETWWPWGIVTGDFDNDGYEDVYLPSGMGHPYGYWASALLMNNGDETFTDRAHRFGIEPPPGGIWLPETIGGKKAARSSRCAAVADFDADGRLDIVVNNFNDRPYYFRNRFPKKNWIAFRLTGTTSNRDAVGALVHLYRGKEVMVRQVHAAGGYLSQSSRTLHFGLGDRTDIDRVEIRWPRGLRQTVECPAVNQLHRISEPIGR